VRVECGVVAAKWRQTRKKFNIRISITAMNFAHSRYVGKLQILRKSGDAAEFKNPVLAADGIPQKGRRSCFMALEAWKIRNCLETYLRSYRNISIHIQDCSGHSSGAEFSSGKSCKDLTLPFTNDSWSFRYLKSLA
jgi:hypothetical protein